VASPHLCLQHVPATSGNGQVPASRSRLAGRLGSAVLLTAAASLAMTLLPGTAVATPGNALTRASTAREATQLVADAQHHLEAVSEQVNEAQVTLEEQRAAADSAGKAVAAAQAQVAALDGQMRQVARSAFTGENLSRFNALMTSGSADEFLAQVTTLDAIAGHADNVLTQVDAAARAAATSKAAADAATAAAQHTLDDVTAQQSQLQTDIADYRKQYASLTATEQEQVNRAHAGTALPPPPKGSTTTGGKTGGSSGVGSVTASSAAAQKAVDTALAQAGDPYVWGAAGPGSFDCSGLMQYAYAAAGISLPHSSRVQSTMGTAVARSDLQPGDLVFFYSPVSHVGMYVGNGNIVHASTEGQPVKVVPLSSLSDYNSARRLG
jgi:cell wall-associated NlpC family hydrolase